MLVRPLIQRNVPLISALARRNISSYPARMSAPHEGSTLKQKVAEQEQELPGLQKDIEPEPFDTKLETAGGPKPYIGIGKLRGKKALITGGE